MSDRALTRLGESTAEAAGGVLRTFCPEGVEIGEVSVSRDAGGIQAVPVPCVSARVSSIDGIAGGNVFAIGIAGARLLAAAMTGTEPPESPGDLSEPELAAVGEAMSQALAAATAAVGVLLGEDVESSTPELRRLDGPEDLEGAFPATPYSVAVPLSVLGEPCTLIQFVSNAFSVRLARALQDLDSHFVGLEPGAEGTLPVESVRAISVRVWAELGRTRMPVARAVGLPAGAIVELDKGADDPVDLFVNGQRFATGRLLAGIDGDWAVRVERVLAVPTFPATANEADL